MNRKPWIRISALVIALALCLSLPRLFPVIAQVSFSDGSYGFSDDNTALGGSEKEGSGTAPNLLLPGADDGSISPDIPLLSDDDNPMSGTQEPEDGGDNTAAGPDGAGDDTASEEFDEGGSPPTETGENPEGFGEQEAEPPADELEEPLSLGASGLMRSDRSVPGYNVFEVNSFSVLSQALSTTSYPSAEHPETGVYILLTGDISIEQGFTLHQSIEKVTIDGDNRHTLSEINLARTQVSPKTAEVTFKNLTIIGNQYFGLLDNPHSTDVTYNYEGISYTGPQLLWASQSTAHFTECNIRIIRGGTDAHEVAEVRDVFIHGDNQFRHSSIHSVFYLYNNGSLVISDDAELRINALSENPYILFTQYPQSKLRLEDRAHLHIEGTSSQLAGSAGLHSIYLGDSAIFNWEGYRSVFDYISINAADRSKDAIYLSEGAEFRVAPNGPAGERLIRIDSGNVVVRPGASLSLWSVLYSAPHTAAPFHLEPGSSLIVGESATFKMEIGNRNELIAGLLYFGGGGQSGFFVDRDATVVIRGNKTSAALHFSGSNSSVEITDPNYLEIAVTTGFPILFYNATLVTPNTLTYTNVQQINYWEAGRSTYLNGGRTRERWVAETESFTVKATFSGSRNGHLSTELAGSPLDQQWTSTFNDKNFDMDKVRILSVGKIGMEGSSEGNAYQGRITAPRMGVPYDQGAVQLRVGQPGNDRAVSARTPATPEFYVAPNQAVDADTKVSVWAEYGYLFHNNPPNTASGTLSLTAPIEIQFGTLPVSFSDMESKAQGTYSLHVQDQRGHGNGWQIWASFGGFTGVGKSLDSTLVVNDVPLQEDPQRIATSTGSETVPLDASLQVPGGTADTGTYVGSITWTLVDAP